MSAELYQRILEDLRARWSALATEAAQIESAITAIETLAAKGAPLPAAQKARKAQPPATRLAKNVRQMRQAEERRREPRQGRSVTDDEILQTVHRLEPTTSRRVIEALGIPNGYRRLAVLEHAGRIVGAGKGRGRTIRVVTTPPATGVPAKAVAPTVPPAPPHLDTSVDHIVERRDRAILARLRTGKATFAELLAAMPDEQLDHVTREAALKNALRRLTLRKQIADVGDKFQLVA